MPPARLQARQTTVTVTGNPITINITAPPGAKRSEMKSLKTTTIAGTITAGGTSQQIAERNPKRDLLVLQNPVGETGALFFNFGAPAALNTTMSLAPGQWVQFDRPCAVPGEALHVLAGDTATRSCCWSGSAPGSSSACRPGQNGRAWRLAPMAATPRAASPIRSWRTPSRAPAT